MKTIPALAAILYFAAAAGEPPVISWDLDKIENGKTAASAGPYKAEIIGSEHVAAVPGKIGQAVHIGGKLKGHQAGALTVRNFKFDFAKPFTAEMLVRFDRGVSSRQRREIFSLADTEHGPGVRFALAYGRLDLSTGDGQKTVSVKTDSNVLRITPDEWHLLSVTYDGQKVSLYFDGVPAGEKTMSVLPARKTRSLSLGSYKNGLAYPLLGALDEFRIYDFCLTPGQAAERYIEIFGE
ncbi:MAG: LamG domain-containing protein [Lentisphaeria bacterium]|nr:LamG domain-containing protein [Lentisphaeria bacterium]